MYNAKIQQWSEAPAGTYNPFANDERCVPVHYISDGSETAVSADCKILMLDDSTLVDYDTFYDYTVDCYVGVTCRDV